VYRLGGHASYVTSVAISPDGRHVVTASADHTAILWDSATAEEARVFSGHGDWVRSVAFSPDGRRVVTGSDDKTAKLYDLATGENVHTLIGHTARVNAVAFSPNGCVLATASDDGSARTWNPATGDAIRKYLGHVGPVTSVMFSPGNEFLLTGGNDGTARLWVLETTEEVQRFSGHADKHRITCVAFSPIGHSRFVLTSSTDKTARLWDVATGEALRTFAGHERTVTSVVFSPDGREILTGSWDREAWIWDVMTGKVVRRCIGHHNDVTCVAFSSDGRWVLTGSWDRTARLWELKRPTMRRVREALASAAVCTIRSLLLSGARVIRAIRRSGLPNRCPHCGSGKIAPILYGLYGEGIHLAMARLGWVVMGGCVVHSTAPRWLCLKCEHKWGMHGHRLSGDLSQETKEAARRHGVTDMAMFMERVLYSQLKESARFDAMLEQRRKSGPPG